MVASCLFLIQKRKKLQSIFKGFYKAEDRELLVMIKEGKALCIILKAWDLNYKGKILLQKMQPIGSDGLKKLLDPLIQF